MKSLFLLAGERSGDRHGAGLMEELAALSPGIALQGMGGGEMHALSPDVSDWVEEAGVVGLVEVLKKYGWFKQKFDETRQRILTLNPDAVVLIDYPGFNLRMAEALRKAGFNFVGSTTMYAFMQGVGMVDDHSVDCLCRTRKK